MDTIKIDKKNSRIISHAGLAGIELQNTAASFIAAGNRSYFGIETDVQICSDGKFVTVHDRNLTNLSGEDINICETPYEVLEKIVLIGKDGTKSRADLRIPTLENYIEICKKYEKEAFLEIKNPFSEDDICKLLATIQGLGYLDKVTFISFFADNLRFIRKYYPSQKAGLLFSNPSEDVLNFLVKEKIDAAISIICINKELIDYFHVAGLNVSCYTVDNKERAEELDKLGVDFIISNILE